MLTGRQHQSPLVQRFLTSLALGGAGLFLTAVAYSIVSPQMNNNSARIGPDCLEGEAVRSLVFGSQDTLPIVDVRDRAEFAAGHIRGALSLPIDEMQARLTHELPRNRLLLVYCGARHEGFGLKGPSMCESAAKLLGRYGYREFVCAARPLRELEGGGVPVDKGVRTIEPNSAADPRRP